MSDNARIFARRTAIRTLSPEEIGQVSGGNPPGTTEDMKTYSYTCVPKPDGGCNWVIGDIIDESGGG